MAFVSSPSDTEVNKIYIMIIMAKQNSKLSTSHFVLKIFQAVNDNSWLGSTKFCMNQVRSLFLPYTLVK